MHSPFLCFNPSCGEVYNAIHLSPHWGYIDSLVHWLIELMNICLNQDLQDLEINRIWVHWFIRFVVQRALA